MATLGYPVPKTQASPVACAGAHIAIGVVVAFTPWYLQVDAGLVASHVRRLKLLHEDEDDADEEPEVHLRGGGRAEGGDSGQRLPHCGLCPGCRSPNGALPRPTEVPSRLVIQGDVRTVAMIGAIEANEFHRAEKRERVS